MREPRRRVRYVHASDGYRLAVTELGPEGGIPVLLVHGFAQNRLAFTAGGLPSGLVALGARVFVGELRGHGLSRDPVAKAADWTVEAHLREDLPALIRHVLETSGAARLHFMGHSMGGILGYASLPDDPPFASLTGFAAPVLLGAGRPVVRLAAAAGPAMIGLASPHRVPMDRFLGLLSGHLARADAALPVRAFQRYTGLSSPSGAAPDALEAILATADPESPAVLRELAGMALSLRPKVAGVDLVGAIRGWRGRLAAVVGAQDIFANPKTVRPIARGQHAGPRLVHVIRGGRHVDVTMGHHVPETLRTLWRFLIVDRGAERA